MKRLLSVMMVLALFLPMISCGEPAQAIWSPPADATKAYTIECSVTGDRTTDAQGELLAEYRYEIPVMEAVDGAPDTVLEVAETFNAEMQALLDSCMTTGRQLGTWSREDPKVEGGSVYYSDRLTASWREQGSILCVTFQRYEDRLGPHPNVTYNAYLFDLDRACYVDPLELSDDPEAFREAVAEQILEDLQKDADLQLGLYGDYADAVARWNEACVSLEGEALVVTFSAYTLAPHAAGPLSFRIPYEEAELGEGGLALLGLTK